jgi:hypothetical protein
MIYRNVDGNICEIKKTDVPNDSLYYKKIYENMLKIRNSADNGKNTDNCKVCENGKNGNIAKREKQKSPLKKAFQDKEKKQSKEKNKNVAASEVHV